MESGNVKSENGDEKMGRAEAEGISAMLNMMLDDWHVSLEKCPDKTYRILVYNFAYVEDTQCYLYTRYAAAVFAKNVLTDHIEYALHMAR